MATIKLPGKASYFTEIASPAMEPAHFLQPSTGKHAHVTPHYISPKLQNATLTHSRTVTRGDTAVAADAASAEAQGRAG